MLNALLRPWVTSSHINFFLPRPCLILAFKSAKHLGGSPYSFSFSLIIEIKCNVWSRVNPSLILRRGCEAGSAVNVCGKDWFRLLCETDNVVEDEDCAAYNFDSGRSVHEAEDAGSVQTGCCCTPFVCGATPGCLRPSISLTVQNRGLKHQSFVVLL